MLLSKNSCFVNTGWRFFQILWPSHNVLTLSKGQDNGVANRNQIRNQIERSFLGLNIVSFNSIRAVCNTNGRAPRSTPAADGYVR